MNVAKLELIIGYALPVLLGASTHDRKHFPKVLESPNDELSRSSSGAPNVFNVTNFVLKLLPSKDGTVLRRLLMTADGTSILRAFLSEDAGTVRQQLCRAIADVLYQWMARVISKDLDVTASSQTLAADCNYQLLLTDRRLKVVFKKVLNDARRDWVLMLRFSWTSAVMFVVASATASHRLIVSLSETYLSRISFSPIRAVAST